MSAALVAISNAPHSFANLRPLEATHESQSFQTYALEHQEMPAKVSVSFHIRISTKIQQWFLASQSESPLKMYDFGGGSLADVGRISVGSRVGKLRTSRASTSNGFRRPLERPSEHAPLHTGKRAKARSAQSSPTLCLGRLPDSQLQLSESQWIMHVSTSAVSVVQRESPKKSMSHSCTSMKPKALSHAQSRLQHGLFW